MENAELGKLIQDHRATHKQAARKKAELEQIGEELILLGNNLKNQPQNIRSGEAKITVKDSGGDEKTILLSTLDTDRICNAVDELIQFAAQEQQIARQLRDAKMGYIVDGLENRRSQTPDILQHPR